MSRGLIEINTEYMTIDSHTAVDLSFVFMHVSRRGLRLLKLRGTRGHGKRVNINTFGKVRMT